MRIFFQVSIIRIQFSNMFYLGFVHKWRSIFRRKVSGTAFFNRKGIKKSTSFMDEPFYVFSLLYFRKINFLIVSIIKLSIHLVNALQNIFFFHLHFIWYKYSLIMYKYRWSHNSPLYVLSIINCKCLLLFQFSISFL